MLTDDPNIFLFGMFYACFIYLYLGIVQFKTLVVNKWSHMMPRGKKFIHIIHVVGNIACRVKFADYPIGLLHWLWSYQVVPNFKLTRFIVNIDVCSSEGSIVNWNIFVYTAKLLLQLLLLMCNLHPRLVLKLLPHSVQQNGFTPLCVVMCLFK